MKFNADNIPEVMIQLNHWVLWGIDKDNPKRPYLFDDKHNQPIACDPTNFDKMLAFSDAITIAEENNFGIGFAFSGDGIVNGIDLDHCVINGELTAEAKEIIDQFKDTYIEYSPSGEGVHIYFADTDIKDVNNRKSNGKEIYIVNHYFTVTGNKVADSGNNVKDYRGLAKKFINSYINSQNDIISLNANDRKEFIKRHSPKPKHFDDELLELIKKSNDANNFKKLFDNGDTSKYGGDDSAADFALMCKLAYWTECNAAQMERLFSQSKLSQRKKWQREDYRERTIVNAIAVQEDKQIIHSQIDEDKLNEFDKQSDIQAAETQKAIEILESVTDFSKSTVFSEEILHAGAICYVYAIKDFECFREKCKNKDIRIALLDSKIKNYAKPIQDEKNDLEKQRWTKLKKDEYKQEEEEKEKRRLDNLNEVKKLSKNENIDKDKLISIIRNSLERTKKGKVIANTRNFNLIIYNDPFLRGCVGFNAFNNRIVPLKTLPWQCELVKIVAWRDSDDSAMQNYIDINYSLRSDKVFKDAIDEYAQKNSFHPVRDFFNNLPQWDNKPRAETVFIDSLDIEDSEYTRKISLHWLLGAVARIFNPGCKFDYCLVTKGIQGIGKSTILRKLAINKDWFNDSFDSFEGKDALEQLQGSWIIEIGEMQATRKSDNEKIKSFISRQIDEFRKAYGYRKESYPRQCVFSATTNSESLLEDSTGGRRFLILVSEAKPHTIKQRMEKFTPDYILQIWAEVFHIYNEMFKNGFNDELLDIPNHLKKIAREYQERYTGNGALVGFVTDYLDKEFPINWELLTKWQRRKWIRDEHGNITCKILKKRDLISAHEIAFEVLNIDNPGKDKATITEISNIVANLTGWERLKKQVRIGGGYGQQKVVFRRLPKPLADD